MAASPAAAATGHGLRPPGDAMAIDEGQARGQHVAPHVGSTLHHVGDILNTLPLRDGSHVFDVPGMSAQCRHM